MALIAGQINPANYPQPDYSGVVRSAQMQAQGLANIGASIGGAIKDFGEAKKERKKLDAEIKASVTGIESAIKMGESLGIDVKSSLSPYLDKINDPTIAPVEAAAYAQQAASAIGNILNFGMKTNELGAEKERYKQAALARQAELNAEANKPGEIVEIYRPEGGKQQMRTNRKTGELEPIKIAGQRTSGLSNLPDPLKPFANDFESVGAKYGVDPVFLAAIAMHETGNGTSSAFLNKRNAMGVSNESGPIEMGSVAESIERMGRLLGEGINQGKGPYANAKSIADIANVYAPPGAGNDPKNLNQFWTKGVASNIERLSQTPSTQDNAQDQFGVVPDKQEETYRPFTEEEIARYGSDGQVSSTGKVYPIRPPTGTEFIVNPDGSTTYRQGAGVGGKAKAQKEAAEAYKMGNATALSQELNLLEDTTKDMVPGVAGSVARAVGQEIPGTELASRKKIIDRVVSTLTLQGLQNMRNSSPTGASLGNISNMDVGLLRDSATALSNIQDPEAFQRELVRLQNLQHNIIYGSEQVLQDKLKKKEITQDQFDEAMAMAPKSFINERGAVITRKNESKPKIGLSPEGQSAREAIRNQ